MVSLATPMPDQTMKAATARPMGPSRCTPVNAPMTQAASTAAVEITSLRLSLAAADRAAESMRLPSTRLNRAIHSFTAMESKSTSARGTEKATGAGCRIFSMEDLPSSTPISRISAATARPVMYSTRAWPKGWSSSAGFSARRKPSRVSTEPEASVRLLTASAVMATEPEIRPMTSLAANRPMFSAMPIRPAVLPQAVRAGPALRSPCRRARMRRI